MSTAVARLQGEGIPLVMLNRRHGSVVTDYVGMDNEGGIEAAIDLAARYLGEAGTQLRHRIISSPHEALVKQIETSTWFGSQTKLDLEGETAS